MTQQLSQREKILALVVVACALAVGGYHWVWVPIRNLVLHLDQQVIATQARLLKGMRMLREAPTIRAQYDTLAPLHQLKGTNEEMVASILRSLEELSRKSNVTIMDIKPRPGQDEAGLRKYLIEIDMEAPMAALFAFLQDLESSEDLFSVDKINLSPKGRESKSLRAYLLLSRTVWL